MASVLVIASVPPPKAFTPLPRRAPPFIIPPISCPPGTLIAASEIPSYTESIVWVISPLAPSYSVFYGIKDPTKSEAAPIVAPIPLILADLAPSKPAFIPLLA
nr:MAG TPA: hypothetical protein [Bacteriophage sp.]